MGRTVPSFTIVFEEEIEEWKAFRNALDKSERKELDETFDIPDSTFQLRVLYFQYYEPFY